jgi:hypothetical protein
MSDHSLASDSVTITGLFHDLVGRTDDVRAHRRHAGAKPERRPRV